MVVPLSRTGGTECSSACHCLHCLHLSLASGQTTGRKHSPAHQQKIGLDLRSVAPPISTRPSFPLSPPQSGSFHKPLILIHQRADRMKTTITKRKKVKVKSLSHVFATPWIVCSLPGSSIRGIFQARVLEWVSISFSRGSSQPRDQTWVSRIAGRHVTI